MKNLEYFASHARGEWTGYYASAVRDEPVVKVKALYYRNDPIIHGELTCKASPAWHPIPIHSAPILWNLLERAGIEGIKGVWFHGTGAMVIPVISIEQLYPGHAKHVATAAAGIWCGNAMAGRWVIVVDEDINISSLEEVLWALCTRCDPETSIEIIKGFLNTPLDPILSPEKRAKNDFTQAKVLITACKPYDWRENFPSIAQSSQKLREKVLEKFGTYFKGT
ncbi:MAG: UbiD family decarboxylase [Candidatus Methanomethyliaceae archaeon]